MWGVATKCTIPSNKSSNPLPLSNRTRVDVDIVNLTRIKPLESQNRYALIIREICSRHVVPGPCEHVVCAVSQKRLPVVMCHASAFQCGDCHQSHVCVVCAWLNVGELPRFDNQPQDLAVSEGLGVCTVHGLPALMHYA